MQDILRIVVPIGITHLVALVAIILVIKKLLLSDTMRAVERVKQVETEVRRKEEGIRKEIEQHEAEFGARKAEAEAELEQRRQESEKEVAKIRDQTLAQARKDGDKLIDQAKKNEEKLRKQIAQDMEEKAVVYGGEVFKLVFSENMTSELNKHFIGELLDALDEVDAASITVDTDDVAFTSSHALDPEQKARLEKLLDEKFGAKIKVREQIQPDLLGGLIFKLGSLEIDGSLRNRYAEAVDEVKKTAHA